MQPPATREKHPPAVPAPDPAVEPDGAPARRSPGATRMPANSSFYNRWVPFLLLGMGVLMLVLVLVAAGVLLGWVRF